MSLAQKDYRKGIKKTSGGYQPGIFSRDKNDISFSKTGASGDASIATPQKGEKILSIMTQRWLEILTEFSTVQTSE
jgi:creatinine amidohydrolase/Fe(II)-dependent formamide hydrolase-like protein